MKYLPLLLLVSLFVTACGGDAAAVEQAAKEATEKAQETAYESMMEAHDRVMPMMGKITAAQRSIKEELESEGLADDRKDILEAGYQQLEDAGDKMMDWMSQVKPLDKLREEMDNEGVMAYVKEQASSISHVEEVMNAAIAAGAELVGETHSHDHGEGDHDHDHGHDHGDHKH